MDPNLLREKILEIGDGSFNEGVEKVYSSFVGLRQKFGVNSRFRDSMDAFKILYGHELVSSWGDFKKLMSYIVKHPVRYSSDNTRIVFNVEERKRMGLEGYVFYRKESSVKEYNL